jgi:hypothetical protein
VPKGREVSICGLLAPLVLCSLATPVTRAHAEALAWDGTFSLELFSSDPALRSWEFSGSGVAISTGPQPVLQTLRLRGGISDTDTFFLTDPDTAGNSVAAIQAQATLGIGTLAPFPPLLFWPYLASKAMPVHGEVRVCYLTLDCNDSQPLLRFAQGYSPALGVGGLVTLGPSAEVQVSLQGAPWTIATATVPVPTAGGGGVTAYTFGFVHGPLSASGTTGWPGGEIQLVTPLVVQTAGAPAVPGFGRLELRFVPEPAGLLPLACAVLALYLGSRKRLAP